MKGGDPASAGPAAKIPTCVANTVITDRKGKESARWKKKSFY